MSEESSADDAVKSTSGELQFCVVLQASTDAGEPSSGELQFCAVPHCIYSAANYDKWMQEICLKHKEQHQSCGCKPTILLCPLPKNHESKEQFMKPLNLHTGSLYFDSEIKLCSEHFESCSRSESKSSVPSIQNDANVSVEESSLPHDAGASRLQQCNDEKFSRESQQASEEMAIAVLSSGLKRPAENDDADEERLPSAKKVCQEDRGGTINDQLIDTATRSPASETSPVKSSSAKTSPTQLGKPKYRASSPTIMTTRRKSQKDLTNPLEAGMERSLLSDQHVDKGVRKRNGTTCVVPGCPINGSSNPGVKWYKIPKDERLRTIWLSQIGRPDLEPKKFHRICSMHFEGGCKTFDRIIPTIDVPTSINKELATDCNLKQPTVQLKALNQSSSSKMAFLSKKSLFSRPWSISGNSTGSMCCIPGCKSTRRRNLGLKYYRFPKEEHVHYQWLASIGLKNFMPGDNSRVCSAHFEGGTRSDKNSIPTIFSADTIALRGSNTGSHQLMDIKKEPGEQDTLKRAAELAFHRQMSPRKQAAPQKLTSSKMCNGNYCCISGCNSRYITNPNLSFYRIPNNKKQELRRQWLEAIGINAATKEARVCSLHFEGGRKGPGSRVPTIFPDGRRPSVKQNVVKDSPSKSNSVSPVKNQPVASTQSSIDTLLKASDLLSQQEAKCEPATSSSTIVSPVKMEYGELLPEVPKGSSCMVPGCGNTRSNARGRVRWYRVPKDAKKRKLWLDAIGWPNAVPSDTTRICSAHFVEGIYRKKGDKAVPTIFPPKPKDWQERYPQCSVVVSMENTLKSIKKEPPLSPSHSMTSVTHPLSPGSMSPRGEQFSALPLVSRDHFQTHPYGPTMLSPEMFELYHKQQESRGVTCCVSKCQNNTKRTHGLRWYRIPVDPTIREQWIRFIRATRPGFKPKNNHRVCSAHFEGGMKISKSSVPTVHDNQYNRRFLPPNYQQVTEYTGSELVNHQQQHMYSLQQQGLSVTDVVHQQRLASANVAGPGGDAHVAYTKPYRVQNLNTPITERSILPLAYREKMEPVYVKQQVEAATLHELSIQISGDCRTVKSKQTTDDDLSVPSSGFIEEKKTIGGGGRCFVPRCANTRRHNPGLKWYRIPKDPDLRILWLDKIGRRDVEPKPHNRICSEHFEGGYKQCNTSLPTIEKWSSTSKHVYTGVVKDPTASQLGSALLATDSQPVAVVEANFSSTTTSQMQSLANSLTALAADYVVASGGETFSEGRELSSIDHSHSTNDSILNSDQLDDSLERSPSSCSSRSSSVVSYSCSPQHDPSQSQLRDRESQGGCMSPVGSLELGSTSTPIHVFASNTKPVVRYQSSPSYQDYSESSVVQDHRGLHIGHTASGLQDDPDNGDHQMKGESDDAMRGDEKAADNVEKTDDEGLVKDGGLNNVNNNNVQKKEIEDTTPNASIETKSDLEKRVKHLEGLMETMCEDLQLKEEKIQEQHLNLTSCQRRLKDKEGELERVKQKCLLMSIRLNSFRKLALTGL